MQVKPKPCPNCGSKYVEIAVARQLYYFDSCVRRSGCACGVVGGITMTVIGLLCLLAATVCVACAFINKE